VRDSARVVKGNWTVYPRRDIMRWFAPLVLPGVVILAVFIGRFSRGPSLGRSGGLWKETRFWFW